MKLMGEVSRLRAPPVHPLLWGHPEQRVTPHIVGLICKIWHPLLVVPNFTKKPNKVGGQNYTGQPNNRGIPCYRFGYMGSIYLPPPFKKGQDLGRTLSPSGGPLG